MGDHDGKDKGGRRDRGRSDRGECGEQDDNDVVGREELVALGRGEEDDTGREIDGGTINNRINIRTEDTPSIINRGMRIDLPVHVN